MDQFLKLAFSHGWNLRRGAQKLEQIEDYFRSHKKTLLRRLNQSERIKSRLGFLFVTNHTMLTLALVVVVAVMKLGGFATWGTL